MASILLINGSPHVSGCTATALEEMIGVFHQEGMETYLLPVGNQSVRGCFPAEAAGSGESACSTT